MIGNLLVGGLVIYIIYYTLIHLFKFYDVSTDGMNIYFAFYIFLALTVFIMGRTIDPKNALYNTVHGLVTDINLNDKNITWISSQMTEAEANKYGEGLIIDRAADGSLTVITSGEGKE
jgi:hypothetical protein